MNCCVVWPTISARAAGHGQRMASCEIHQKFSRNSSAVQKVFTQHDTGGSEVGRFGSDVQKGGLFEGAFPPKSVEVASGWPSAQFRIFWGVIFFGSEPNIQHPSSRCGYSLIFTEYSTRAITDRSYGGGGRWGKNFSAPSARLSTTITPSIFHSILMEVLAFGS